ncbi:Ribosomal protein S18 acetylase RimI [Desulfuromusa kysingii]|uniref:Ribosomal protein S18 acetylase RimI n=1 Tax=Desulfuromusa kysingii TaxID=37625 RepID=A0A1H4A356_9BACT|nr:GNAT family N-acetyltransferase [Desulfuromusa kysingii]SEA29962.1 Ribosomal protein S18 acetylase RimI [Desulfuromusa kysingii]
MRAEMTIKRAASGVDFSRRIAQNQKDSMPVRQANPDDARGIEALMEEYDMVGSFDYQQCLVIDAGAAGLAGFARMDCVGNRFYIRPIIISTRFQRQGLGKLLVEYLLSIFDDITVIARGSAEGFYRALGFSPIGWEQIDEDFCRECQFCPDLTDCIPVPMRIIQPTRGRSLV